MPVLEFLSDKTLSLMDETILSGENNADDFILLLPKYYKSHFLRDFNVTLCIYESGNANMAMMNFIRSEEDYLVYSLPITSALTSAGKKIIIWIEISNSATQTVIKSKNQTLRIEEKYVVSDYLSEKELALLTQWQMKMNTLYQNAQLFSSEASESAVASALSASKALEKATEAQNSASFAVVSETSRVNAENQRSVNEQQRIDSEDFRNISEITRTNAENARLTAELQRENNEIDRIMMEDLRVQNEIPRNQSEIERINAENERIASELWRNNNEEGRIMAESARADDARELEELLNNAQGEISQKADKLTVYTPENILVAGEDGSYSDSGVPLNTVVNSWSKVQAIVRSGSASQVFSIGDQLECMRGNDTLVWDIIGFDQDIPADSSLTHSMTLQLNSSYSAMVPFGGPEAVYYSDMTYPADTYTIMFTDENQSILNFHFTAPEDIPSGSVIKLIVESPYQGSYIGNIYIYPSQSAENYIMSFENLYPDMEFYSILSPINDYNRVNIGSNSYEYSTLRQWLNSSEEANLWWKPKATYDLKPSYASSPGFLNGIDEDFLAVIGEVGKTTALNTVTDGGGVLYHPDKFFLLSAGEVGGTDTGGISEGTPYEYYEKMLQNGVRDDGEIGWRAKWNDEYGFGESAWLRSPAVTSSHKCRYIDDMGAIRESDVGEWMSISPACCIV